METANSFSDASLWILIPVLLFTGLIIYFLFKFFAVLFDFIQAKGCLTIALLVLVGLPAILVLSIISDSTISTILLTTFSVVGVITGYIARDAEGNVGKFGQFIMIVSVIALIAGILLKISLICF